MAYGVIVLCNAYDSKDYYCYTMRYKDFEYSGNLTSVLQSRIKERCSEEFETRWRDFSILTTAVILTKNDYLKLKKKYPDLAIDQVNIDKLRDDSKSEVQSPVIVGDLRSIVKNGEVLLVKKNNKQYVVVAAVPIKKSQVKYPKYKDKLYISGEYEGDIPSELIPGFNEFSKFITGKLINTIHPEVGLGIYKFQAGANKITNGKAVKVMGSLTYKFEDYVGTDIDNEVYKFLSLVLTEPK